MRVSRNIIVGLGAALAVSLGSVPAFADYYAFGYSGYDSQETLSLSTSSGPVALTTNGFQGWFSPVDTNTAGPSDNTNYVTGISSGISYNDFFAFDVSSLSGDTVTAASLNVTNYDVTNPLNLRLGAVSVPSDALYNGVSPDVAIYDALGSGTLYGNYALEAEYNDSIDSFALNSAAIGDINSDIGGANQYFVVGGTVNSLASIPEPSTLLLMLSIFSTIAAGRILRRRRVVC